MARGKSCAIILAMLVFNGYSAPYEVKVAPSERELSRGGIVIGDGGNFRTLAHEIGHACDRRDIYPSNGGFAVSGAVSETREPKDWNSGPGPQYYDTSLDQENLIYRLLMYGTYSTTKADIPRGSIYGVWKPLGGVYQKSQAPVGLDGMDRTPTHN